MTDWDMILLFCSLSIIPFITMFILNSIGAEPIIGVGATLCVVVPIWIKLAIAEKPPQEEIK